MFLPFLDQDVAIIVNRALGIEPKSPLEFSYESTANYALDLRQDPLAVIRVYL